MSQEAPTTADPVLGLILAGGRAARMGGGDKCLRPLGERPLLAHVVERLAPQVDGLALSANGAPERFAAFGLPVLGDALPDFPGPLAGILAGLEWAAGQDPAGRFLVSVPGDGPFLPRDLVRRLLAARREADAELALAASGGQLNPVVGLWPLALAADLRRALLRDGLRKVSDWTGRFRVAVAAWPAAPLDPFFNANTPDELAAAERLLPLAL